MQDSKGTPFVIRVGNRLLWAGNYKDKGTIAKGKNGRACLFLYFNKRAKTSNRRPSGQTVRDQTRGKGTAIDLKNTGKVRCQKQDVLGPSVTGFQRGHWKKHRSGTGGRSRLNLLNRSGLNKVSEALGHTYKPRVPGWESNQRQ